MSQSGGGSGGGDGGGGGGGNDIYGRHLQNPASPLHLDAVRGFLSPLVP